MIWYGIVKRNEDELGEYKRIEVFKEIPWRRHEVARMWGFFKRHIPKDNLVIYVIRNNNLEKPFLKHPLNAE